jgi:hypothetical protein
MIGHIRGVIDGVVLSSNALPQLVMAALLMVQSAGFTMAMRCAPATQPWLDPLHMRWQLGCSARTIIVLRSPGEVAWRWATGLSANH